MRGLFTYLHKELLTLTFIVISFSAFSQCPAGLALSTDNLITNGDFSAGNTGFTSDHNYCNSAGCLTTGMYTVGTDPSFYNASLEGADHTTGNGNFLIVNGDTGSNPAIWCQTIPVDPSSFYEISYWVSSLSTQNQAQIQLYINTFPFFSTMIAPSSTNTWLQFAQTWTSGFTTSADVCLVNLNTSNQGNDFGIDDISIKKCICNLSVDAGDGGSICKGDSIDLHGTGATTYFWSPTNSLSCWSCQDPIASPQQTTTYTITVMGPGNCTVYDSVTVEVFPTLDLGAGPDTSICPGESVQLHAEGIVNYQWIPTTGLSNGNIPNPVASPASTTTYFLFGQDEHGCSQSDSMSIIIFPQPAAPVASGDTTICEHIPTPLHVEAEGTIEWTPPDFLSCSNCFDPISLPDSSITYTVSVIDFNGCYAGMDAVTIIVDTACVVVLPPAAVMPSAFSPNMDGVNDYFHVLGEGVTNFHLDIYNRWGALIFSTNDPSLGWDGTYQGAKQEVGVYVWRMVADLVDGTHVVRNGNVTLVR